MNKPTSDKLARSGERGEYSLYDEFEKAFNVLINLKTPPLILPTDYEFRQYLKYKNDDIIDAFLFTIYSNDYNEPFKMPSKKFIKKWFKKYKRSNT